MDTDYVDNMKRTIHFKKLTLPCEILRFLRKINGLTQADLGTKIGVSHQQVQKYESGSDAIIDKLKKISEIFEVPQSIFFPDIQEALVDRVAMLETDISLIKKNLALKK